MRSLQIEAGSFSYKALVDAGLLQKCGELLSKNISGLGKKAMVISDDKVADKYLELVKTSLRSAGFETYEFLVNAGEESKSLQVYEDILRTMAVANCDRSSFVVALGGGVVGDLAGFVAATYYRGVQLIQIPTTIVAMCDSSLGGKTGVNLPEGKNLVGAFQQPSLIIADTQTLLTLPAREYRQGFAEVIKHAAIRKPKLLRNLQKFVDVKIAPQDALIELIAANIEIKAKIVAEDEKETKGLRALLNFGHSIGHAIEAAGDYKQYLHGEAIAIGIRAALWISQEYVGLDEAHARKIEKALNLFELPRKLPRKFASDEDIWQILQKDKKNIAGELTFVLLKELGDAHVFHGISKELVYDALARIR